MLQQNKVIFKEFAQKIKIDDSQDYFEE